MSMKNKKKTMNKNSLMKMMMKILKKKKKIMKKTQILPTHQIDPSKQNLN